MIEIGIIVAVLIGLGQVAKQLGLPAKYVPVMNLVLGIVAGMVGGVGASLYESIINGAIIGLTASGLYDMKKPAKKE